MNKCIIDYTSLPIIIAFVILTVIIHVCVYVCSKLFPNITCIIVCDKISCMDIEYRK